MLAVLLLSPAELLPEVAGPDWLDKLLHAVVFAIHCALLARGLAGVGRRVATVAAAALISALYALLLETAQLWIPGRSWEWWDVAAGLAGVALAAAIAAGHRARLPAAPEA